MSKHNSDEYDDEDDETYDEDEDDGSGDDEDDEDDHNETGDSDDIDEDDDLEGEEDESENEDEDSDEEEEDSFLTSDDDDDEEEDDNSDESDDEDTTPNYEEGLVYVIMPYTDEHLNEVFTAISGECSSLGLDAQLASEGVGSGLVIEKIRYLTERAEFIICDLTGERANVYYELGQAHGLGNDASRVLLIAKQGTPLPFNVASLHVYYYQSTEHLRAVIASNLQKMIQATRE